MKFVAKKLDLDLELTLLTGEEIALSPSIKTDAKSCSELSKKMVTIEDNAEKTAKGLLKDGLDVLSSELSLIYPKDKDWFLSNLDPASIKAIIEHVANTIGGATKKSESSS